MRHISAKTGLSISVAATLALAIAPAVPAASAEEPAIVSNVKVVSDKVEDVSSIDAWMASTIKPGMSDREKALAIWRSAASFRQGASSPIEYLVREGDSWCVHDPIKLFNVYGYGICCESAMSVEALARACGLQTRGRGIHGHSVAEVYWDNGWHMLDASLRVYFCREDGEVASIDEILQEVDSFYKEHGDLKGNDRAAINFMKGGGWLGGPEVLTRPKWFSENGWLPGNNHGWFTILSCFDGTVNHQEEFPYVQGYRVNVELRDGERLERNWFNKGLHVNSDITEEWGNLLAAKPGEGDMVDSPNWGDLAPGRIGNGTHSYDVPLADGVAKRTAAVWENVATTADDKASPAAHVKSPGAPAAFAIWMRSSYVYLGGRVDAKFVIGEGGSVRVLLSRNHGADWKEIYARKEAGAFEESIDLEPHVSRLYDYLLKFEMSGAGTGVDALHVENDIQESQRALPALAQGDNRIAFSAGPAEGTVTVEGATVRTSMHNQLAVMECHPTLDGMELTDNDLRLTRNGGSVTFPVETPGDMARIRFGMGYETEDPINSWDLLVSFDDGKIWHKAGNASGVENPTAWVTYAGVPEGTRKALVRYVGWGKGFDRLINFRIDADYAQPNGGFRPVKVTYVWDEAGAEKRDVHAARSPEESYSIHCAEKPVMKSLIVELAQ